MAQDQFEKELLIPTTNIGNCDDYMALTPVEQAAYLGQIIIALQRDPGLFKIGMDIIFVANGKGIYDKAKPITQEELPIEAKLDITNPIEQ